MDPANLRTAGLVRHAACDQPLATACYRHTTDLHQIFPATRLVYGMQPVLLHVLSLHCLQRQVF